MYNLPALGSHYFFKPDLSGSLGGAGRSQINKIDAGQHQAEEGHETENIYIGDGSGTVQAIKVDLG